MAAIKFRADYEELGRIARMFGEQAATCGQMLASVKVTMAGLEGGGWIGPGATAFYSEMNGQVLPSLRRLIAALEQAGAATVRINSIANLAEGDAARVLAKITVAPSAAGPIPIPYPNLSGAAEAVGQAIGLAESTLDDLISRSAAAIQGDYGAHVTLIANTLEYLRLIKQESTLQAGMALVSGMSDPISNSTPAVAGTIAQSLAAGSEGALALAAFVASAVSQNAVVMPDTSIVAGLDALVGPALAALGSSSVGAIGQAASEALAAVTRGDIGPAATYEERVLLALMDLGRNAGQDFANAQDAFSRWSAENGQLTQARDAINGGLRVVKGMIDSVAAPEIRSALMSDFGDLEEQTMRMQLAQDGMSKTVAVISNVMKSMHDIQMAVIRNLR